MKFPFYIARRYLFSKKSTNAINIISGISVLGIFIGSGALLVILSVFNGFEGLILSLFNKFSSDIKIEVVEGKRFNPDAPVFDTLRRLPEIDFLVESLEEKALLRYEDSQHIVTLRGVSDSFLETHALDSLIAMGQMLLKEGDTNYAVIGSGVQAFLGLPVVKGRHAPVQVFTPKRARSPAGGFSLIPSGDFNRAELYVSGVFAVQKDFDEQYAIVPLRFMRRLLQEPRDVSSLEIYLKPGTDTEAFKYKARSLLGDGFSVHNRHEQNPTLYKLLNSEKWAVYLILTFVLVIAICNIIGSLTMLVIDKKKDIAILFSMGADRSLVQQIFIAEGMLIALLGCLFGLLAGSAFCLLQQQFGLISMGQTSFIEAYPVELRGMDFLLIFCTVFFIALIAAWFSTHQSLKSFGNVHDQLTTE